MATVDAYDVYNQLFTEVKTLVLADASVPANLTFVRALQESEAVFPRVVLQELNILTDSATLNYAEYTKKMLYQVDIYANGSAAEQTVRRIAKAVNTVLEKTYHLQQRGGGNLIQLDASAKRYTATYVGTFLEHQGVFR